MKKLLIYLIILLLFVSFIPIISSINISNNIIYVNDDNTSGPWDGSILNPFLKIQDAINESSNGDIVFVFNGTYVANNLVNKSIFLHGEDVDGVTITGGTDGFIVTADNTCISNFTIRDCGGYWDNTGIFVTSSENKIFNNKIIRNFNGIFLENTFNNEIYNNIFENNYYHTIRIEFSSNCNIRKNYVINGDRTGIYLWGSHYNTIVENTIENSYWFGISLGESSFENNIYHNNFINNNLKNAVDETNQINHWFDGYLPSGNYWSDYNGADQDADGIGDIEYNISDYGIDKFPLMNNYGSPADLIITGKNNSKIRTEYKININSNDPQNDEIYYYINWSDNSYIQKIGPYKSLEQATLSHIYSKKSDYLIKVKAKDEYGSESNWETFQLTVSNDEKNCNNPNDLIFNYGELKVTTDKECYLYNEVVNITIINIGKVGIGGEPRLRIFYISPADEYFLVHEAENNDLGIILYEGESFNYSWNQKDLNQSQPLKGKYWIHFYYVCCGGITTQNDTSFRIHEIPIYINEIKGGLGLSVYIINFGNYIVNNVECEINISGKILFSGINGNFYEIAPYDLLKIQCIPFGFGAVDIFISTSEESKIINGMLLGPFLKIKNIY